MVSSKINRLEEQRKKIYLYTPNDPSWSGSGSELVDNRRSRRMRFFFFLLYFLIGCDPTNARIRLEIGLDWNLTNQKRENQSQV